MTSPLRKWPCRVRLHLSCYLSESSESFAVSSHPAYPLLRIRRLERRVPPSVVPRHVPPRHGRRIPRPLCARVLPPHIAREPWLLSGWVGLGAGGEEAQGRQGAADGAERAAATGDRGETPSEQIAEQRQARSGARRGARDGRREYARVVRASTAAVGCMARPGG